MEQRFFLVPSNEVTQSMLNDSFESIKGYKPKSIPELSIYMDSIRKVESTTGEKFHLVKVNAAFHPDSLTHYLPYESSAVIDILNGPNFAQPDTINYGKPNTDGTV